MERSQPTLSETLKKRVTYLDEARQEALDAAEWYEEQETGAGRRFVDQWAIAEGKIKRDPQRYPFLIKRVRKCLFNRFPFIVLYRELEEEIQVIAVMHGARRPDYWKSRL